MIIPRAPKWIDQIYAQGRQISLKMHEEMYIGRIVATVIHTIFGLNFVRTSPWEAMFCIIWPMLFFIK